MINLIHIMNQCRCLYCNCVGFKSSFPYKDLCSDECKNNWVKYYLSSDDSSDSASYQSSDDSSDSTTYGCLYCQSNAMGEKFCDDACRILYNKQQKQLTKKYSSIDKIPPETIEQKIESIQRDLIDMKRIIADIHRAVLQDDSRFCVTHKL